jgi:pimeloyl-ACP methyl ester carboxylesterase
MNVRARLAVMALLAALAGCATAPSPTERTQHANALAQARGWVSEDLDTGRFVLRSYHPRQAAGGVLTVYLEGDGLAWLSPTQPSTDPTPTTPLALQLALAQPGGSAAYLARPCQFVGTRHCTSRDWTGARFAPDVVTGTSQAVDRLKANLGARELVLVGYSGGAAIALLVAARREDVRQVITVAGNLDPDAWADWHRVPPLAASDNPARHRDELRALPQVHLVGSRDPVTPAELAQRFQAAYPAGAPSQVIEMPGFDHGCCWAQDWAALWKRHAYKGSTTPR